MLGPYLFRRFEVSQKGCIDRLEDVHARASQKRYIPLEYQISFDLSPTCTICKLVPIPTRLEIVYFADRGFYIRLPAPRKMGMPNCIVSIS